ncbi:MAG TPA: hypothetical protein VK982_01030, partial [Bacteroidales bacterium]|nr:hypothetical protein [Bacteroidales bacterium]
MKESLKGTGKNKDRFVTLAMTQERGEKRCAGLYYLTLFQKYFTTFLIFCKTNSFIQGRGRL